MRRRAAPPPNQPLYPTAPASSQRPPVPPAQTAATSPYAAGGFTPATTLYPGARPQQTSSYGASSVGGGANYGSSSGDESKDLTQTALMHAKWALRGWHDAARPLRVWEMISSDAHLRASVVRSLLINIPILLSLLFLTHLILPLVSNSSPSGRSNSRPGLLAWALTNQFMWEGIGMGVVILANGKWQGQIAERAFGGGRSSGTGGKGLGGGSAGSSLATRTIILLDYFVVTSILHLIPYIGWPLATTYTLFINAYYCFSHAWSARGWSVSDRITFLQTRYAYLAGFGLPLTVVTTLPFLPPLVLTSLYALFYPVFLILASISSPVPSASGSFSNLPLAGEEGDSFAGDGGGAWSGEGQWQHWPSRVFALEGARWAIAVWEKVSGDLALSADARGGHRRRGSRFA